MKNIFKILKLARPMHPLMAVIIIFSILGAVFEIVTPILSGYILDEVILQTSLTQKNYQPLVQLLAVSFITTIVFLFSRSITQRLGDLLAARIRKHLTVIFYNKALNLSQSFYDSQISGKIVNQLNRGIISIQGFTNVFTNFIIPTFLQGIIVIAILLAYNFWVGFLMLIIFPIYLFISSISTKRWGKKEEAKNIIEDKTRGRIQEVISNIKLVKGFTNEENEFNTVHNNLNSINKIYHKQSNEFHLFDFLRESSLYLIMFIVTVIIFYNAFAGIITAGTVIVLIQLVNKAREPLFGMSYILGQIQMAESGSKEFFEILAIPTIEDYTIQTDSKKIIDPQIEFKDISFKYNEGSEVFSNLSFTVKNNEIVALVGPSGAGKSTIANLILKLYKPVSGEIYLNSKPYSQINEKEIRKNIALVFQENELFSTTILENVCYGADVDQEKAIDSLKKANAWDFVQKLPQNINAEIGERGVKLSGGQRQRIQIARAIYKNAPILILDEATSSLDSKSEAEVSEAINNLVKNRLVIIIAHRFSTIQNATKVIVVNNNGIEAIGTPHELAKLPGIYSDLLKYQIEGNKKLLNKFEIF